MKIAFVSRKKHNKSQSSFFSSDNRKRLHQTIATSGSEFELNWANQMKLVLDFIRDTPQPPQTSEYSRTPSKTHRRWRTGSQPKMQRHETNMNSGRMTAKPIQSNPQQLTQAQRKYILSDLFMGRKKFLQKYGYVQNNQEIKKKQEEKKKSIEIVPSIEDAKDRLFLFGVENMIIQKCQERASLTPRSVIRSRRQIENLNQSINKAEELLMSKGEQKQHLDCFIKTKRIMSRIGKKQQNQKIIKDELNQNIEKISENLNKYSNRIYGRKQKAQSVAWCEEVLTAQVEQQFFPKTPKNQNRQISRTMKILQKLSGMQVKTIDGFPMPNLCNNELLQI